MDFTNEQLKAIKIEEGLVTASAGSGKTRILVEKYLEELKNGTNVENLLALTFTDKAAMEMKDRISKRIDDWLESTGDMRWWKLKDHIPFAKISTIHSFCSDVIRENAFLLGIDSEFTVVSEGEKKDIIDTLINDSIRSSPDKYEKCIVQFGVKKVKELLEKIMEERYYLDKIDTKDISSMNYLEDPTNNLKVIELMEEFVEQAKEIRKKYKEHIFKESRFDFLDLLLIVRELFEEHHEVRERYRRRYKCIFVDEFQDTNELQKEIIEAVHKPGVNKIFYVGDEKQSIYRFRGADVSVFINTKKSFNTKNKSVLVMSDNFRSHPQIIGFINNMFSNIMKGEGNEEFSPKYEPMKARVFPKRKFGGVWFVKVEDSNDELGKIARFILHVIKRYENELRERKMIFRNFVILLRKLTNVSTIEKALDKYHIPYYTVKGRGFYEKMEVKSLISFLKLLQDPGDNISLLSILRSPMILADEDMLFMIDEQRRAKNDTSYLEILKGIDDERIKTFLTLYERLHSLKGMLSPSEVLSKVIEEFDLLAILSVFRSSDKMIANVEKLLHMIELLEYQGFNYRDIVEYLTTYASPKESEAMTEVEQANVVRIMSIHQAKGLEFPIVILPQLNASGGNQGDKIIFERGIPIISGLLKENKAASVIKESIKREKMKNLEEEKRLLYVAMTRAQDLLALFLPVEKKNRKQGVWMKILSEESSVFEDWKDSFIEIPDDIQPFEAKAGFTSPRERLDISLAEPIEKGYDQPIVSVTELARQEIKEEVDESKVKELFNAYKGKLFHQVLEMLDNEKKICDLKKEVKMDRRFTERERKELIRILENIKDNPIVKMIENADRVESEMSLEAEMDGKIFYARVDKYFEYKGKNIVVDFKTNKGNKAYEDEQLRNYARILEKVLGKKMNEGYVLYLVKNDFRRVL